ncbi:9428_t:CDS:2 [Racocetra fulgida]|uniref:9428_t:CDS:1 n=1 Tax=Racocetra fulgida TaxID=60492 RepID=A0A9N9CEB4_9GLOM|nr:9428_t:CDS:2 [Racocetra fulgida]
MGTKWAVMSQLLGRPANLIKNRYYSSLSKKRDHVAIDDSDDSTSSTCASPRPKKRRITKDTTTSASLSNDEASRYSHSRKKSFKPISLETPPAERWIPEGHRYPTRFQVNSWHSLKTPISSPEAVDIPCLDLNCPTHNYSPPSNKYISIPTPTYTPIPSPVPMYRHNHHHNCTAALEQLADLAIQNAR